MNGEFERIWKEVVVAYIQILSQHLPGGNGVTAESLSQDRQCPCRGLNGGHPEHEFRVPLLS